MKFETIDKDCFERDQAHLVNNFCENTTISDLYLQFRTNGLIVTQSKKIRGRKYWGLYKQ